MSDCIQAQPKKLHTSADNEEKYREKVALKAEIIVKSANRLWSE